MSEILELISGEEMSRRTEKRKNNNFSAYKGWEVYVDRIDSVSTLENVSAWLYHSENLTETHKMVKHAIKTKSNEEANYNDLLMNNGYLV